MRTNHAKGSIAFCHSHLREKPGVTYNSHISEMRMYKQIYKSPQVKCDRAVMWFECEMSEHLVPSCPCCSRDWGKWVTGDET